MSNLITPTHQNGEHVSGNSLCKINSTFVTLDTFYGKVHVEWDPQAAVTPLGQMPFFIEFLKTTNLFDNFVEDFPLTPMSNRTANKRDVLGTLLLSILSGHTRYAHIMALRCDGVNAPLLGMNKIVSEDTARRTLLRVDEQAGNTCLEKHLRNSYYPLLSLPWIMDIDSTVKVLYGAQEGAEIGYNPKKPGRPSHNYHTYYISNIRMILDVEVEDGKSSASIYSAPKLWEIIDALPLDRRPAFIRGDSSYGTDNIMTAAEERKIKYLFKLKITKYVKMLISQMMQKHDWIDAGKGWQGINSEVQLSTWGQARKVVILRRLLPKDNIGIIKKTKSNQLEFNFAEISADIRAYEYQVLVTNLDDEILTIAQHYRDRADCENNFDELKNQWGWCGYTTNDLKRCGFMAKMIALVYNWWTIFTRLANPNSHLEAVTSRPLLLHAVAKQTTHAGQTKLTVTSTHSKSSVVTDTLNKISAFFKRLNYNAEQWTFEQKFKAILFTAFRNFLPKCNSNDQFLPLLI